MSPANLRKAGENLYTATRLLALPAADHELMAQSRDVVLKAADEADALAADLAGKDAQIQTLNNVIRELERKLTEKPPTTATP